MENANQAIPSSEEMKQRGNRVEFIVLALCAVGLVMVYSASAPFQDQKHLLSADGGWRLLLSQTEKLALALVAYLIGRRLDIEFLRRHSGKLFMASIALLALVFSAVMAKGVIDCSPTSVARCSCSERCWSS